MHENAWQLRPKPERQGCAAHRKVCDWQQRNCPYGDAFVKFVKVAAEAAAGGTSAGGPFGSDLFEAEICLRTYRQQR